MYESYGTYVNDEYVDNHDYDDDTDDNSPGLWPTACQSIQYLSLVNC